MKIDVNATGDIVLSDVFLGVGIETKMGLFGISQRDDGIEVMLNGKTVWTSHDLTPAPAPPPTRFTCDGSCNGDDLGDCSHPEAQQTYEANMRGALAPNGPGVILPDGSGAFVASWPLPKDHWLYAEGDNEPPSPIPIPVGSTYTDLVTDIRAAARYAVRGATMNGTVRDFDPDALVLNVIVGLIGARTP